MVTDSPRTKVADHTAPSPSVQHRLVLHFLVWPSRNLRLLSLITCSPQHHTLSTCGRKATPLDFLLDHDGVSVVSASRMASGVLPSPIRCLQSDAGSSIQATATVRCRLPAVHAADWRGTPPPPRTRQGRMLPGQFDSPLPSTRPPAECVTLPPLSSHTLVHTRSLAHARTHTLTHTPDQPHTTHPTHL